MDRKQFFSTFATATVAASIAPLSACTESDRSKDIEKSSMPYRDNITSITDNNISIYSESIKESIKIVHITDTHLSIDDSRGLPFQKYSKRMASGYKSNIDFETGEAITSPEGFYKALAKAKKCGADIIILSGDIFSFPSEAAVEWAKERLEMVNIPYIYVAGNHDWHYEGMPGTLANQRDEWISKRLLPLYQGSNPLFATYRCKGVKIVAVDNSTYEITTEQLDQLRDEIASNEPFILTMHIPLHIPGRTSGWACGDPSWGGKNDKIYTIEGREKWPEDGHTSTTYSFHKEVFNAKNILAILTGHTHIQAVDIKSNIPQIVGRHNATGAYNLIEIKPI